MLMGETGDTPILRCENIKLSFGGVVALSDIFLDVNKGEIVSIIGPNGAGKTCIINTITGFYRPSHGNINFKGREITGLAPHKVCALGMARTFQNIELFTGLTVLGGCRLTLHNLRGLGYKRPHERLPLHTV